MKYLILVLFINPFLWLWQPKKALYILFDANKTHQYKVGGDNRQIHFSYIIYYKDEKKAEISMDQRVKFRPDTLLFPQLKSIDLKNYQWLRTNYLEYYHYYKGKYIFTDSTGKVRMYNLNKQYDNIYVVEIDSAKCKAVFYKVSQGYAVE